MAITVEEEFDFSEFSTEEETEEETEETTEEPVNEEPEAESEENVDSETVEESPEEVEEDVVDEEDANEEEYDDVRFVDELAKDFGIEFEEEIPDTWDGLKTATKKAAQVQTQRQLNQLFEQYPDLGEYANYRMNGGDPQTYQEQVLNAPSYEDMEISEGDVATQKKLVRERLNGEGYSEDAIKEEIEDLESAGLLKKQAERSKQVLSKRQEKKRQELIKQQEQQKQQQIEQQKQEQQEYINLIQESSDLGGLRVPENKKEDFAEFMFSPTDDSGVTQADKAWNNMSREDRLALEYLVYQSRGNGVDLTSLVDNLASTKKAKSISESLRKTRGNNRKVKDRSSRGANNAKADGDIEDLDMNAIFNS